MTRYFDDPDYNPRRGAGRTGRVRKKDFSIDGRSWDFRDPYNQRAIDRQNTGRERGFTTINDNAQSMTNPLYDYDYGTVRDAAKDLGINNVNSKSEVKDILDYIRGNYKKPKKDEEPKSDYKPTELPEDPYAGGGNNPPKGSTGPGGMPKPGDFGTNRPPGSIPYIPPSSDEGRAAYGTAGSGGKTSLDTAIESVADYGNRATDDYFGRFLPEMGLRNTNESKATGRALLSSIQNFTGKVPQLGDPKDLFKYYMGKID